MVTLPTSASGQDIVDAASKVGVRRVPAVFASALLAPVANADPAAVPTMRVAILQERGNAAGKVDVRIDLPPMLNTIEPVRTDPVAAFEAAPRAVRQRCRSRSDELRMHRHSAASPDGR